MSRPQKRRLFRKSSSTGKRGEQALGKVIGTRAGHGFVVLKDKNEEWFLPFSEMNRVLDADLVRVRASKERRRGKPVAVVEEIVERPRQVIVGRYMRQDGRPAVIPDSERIPRHVSLVKPYPVAKVGDLVEVHLIPSKGLELPYHLLGRATRILGAANKAQLEIDLALVEFNLSHEFPQAVLAQLKGLPDEVDPNRHQDRRDLRAFNFVTIDGEDARDYDDAVFCRRTKGGWHLWVAIADVSHYVRPGQALDTEAQTRTTSIYFPDRVVPMLPPKLSNGLCSLNPRTPRLVLVCEMRIDAGGSCKDVAIYKAVIVSQARLTYEQAAALVEEANSPLPSHQPPSTGIVHSLQDLRGLTHVLLKNRKDRAALDFRHLEEVRVHLTASGEVEDITIYQRNFAHLMIEEAMLIANVEVAKFLAKRRGLPFCYRIHEPPEKEKFDELRLFLNYYHIKIPGDKITPEAYRKILERVQRFPEAAVLEQKVLRSMRQACYARRNLGHFGLNYEYYTHFTSPIRRYPDLLVHRAIKRVLLNEGPGAERSHTEYPYSAVDIDRLATRCSEYERATEKAVWRVVDACKCRYLARQGKTQYQGSIVHVAEFGFFVQLDGVPIDGLVHVRNLHNDHYKYDAADHTLVGVRRGKTYRLGQKIAVRVDQISAEDRKIDLVPL